jgi:hypothetical protein
MRALLGFLLIFGIIGTLLLALGAGIGFTAQLFARISSLPLDDPLDDLSFGEPFTPQRITYLIDPTPPQRRRKRKQP